MTRDRSEQGLSPRVRGNRSRIDAMPSIGRSIPACAGEPIGVRSTKHPGTVYPRVCGGTRARLVGKRYDLGLSPRVRGNRRPGLVGSHQRGSIPACAGEPWSSPPWPRCRRVYPRVCGGTQIRGRVEDVALGSIPACAGEPTRLRTRTRSRGVYPRVCGGTARLSSSRTRGGGLSPRVRGNLRNAGQLFPQHRSIPACAGEPHGPPIR